METRPTACAQYEWREGENGARWFAEVFQPRRPPITSHDWCGPLYLDDLGEHDEDRVIERLRELCGPDAPVSRRDR